MNTSKYSIKKINMTGKGTYVYISKREREHMGVQKLDDVILDMSIPYIIKIMSIDRWRHLLREKEKNV